VKLTLADILRVQREARETMRQLAKLYPGAFDKNGKPLVATLRLPAPTTGEGQ
jgi:hypothetical protein